ncbi:hypothetical protein B0H10DRAFT_1958489 [Mycena sp. CBHHK59/15]|nr:hypothetical protein B0H10DRAFT_1958489 [Mycena sp. CBHHK59/15]
MASQGFPRLGRVLRTGIPFQQQNSALAINAQTVWTVERIVLSTRLRLEPPTLSGYSGGSDRLDRREDSALHAIKTGTAWRLRQNEPGGKLVAVLSVSRRNVADGNRNLKRMRVKRKLERVQVGWRAVRRSKGRTSEQELSKQQKICVRDSTCVPLREYRPTVVSQAVVGCKSLEAYNGGSSPRVTQGHKSHLQHQQGMATNGIFHKTDAKSGQRRRMAAQGPWVRGELAPQNGGRDASFVEEEETLANARPNRQVARPNRPELLDA